MTIETIPWEAIFSITGADAVLTRQGAAPLKTSTGNNFPREYQRIPREYYQCWRYILVKFCPSALYCQFVRLRIFPAQQTTDMTGMHELPCHHASLLLPRSPWNMRWTLVRPLLSAISLHLFHPSVAKDLALHHPQRPQLDNCCCIGIDG